MNIYVGNLSYETTEAELRQAFEKFGEVSTVNIIMDRETGRSKGFGFIEMPQTPQAQEAIKQMNGASLKGKNLVVNEARPRESKPSRGGSRGGRRW
jgi:RNA recognition motif-containing protein